MKHIKTKRIFESYSIPTIPNDIKEDLKDICLDITDVGFKIDFQLRFENKIIDPTFNNINHVLEISYNMNYHGSFWFKDIEEVVQRIKDYFDDNYRGVQILGGYSGTWLPFDISKDISTQPESRFEIYGVRVEFKIKNEPDKEK